MTSLNTANTQMMQPTPAPTSPPSSQILAQPFDEEPDFPPPPPVRHGTAPFSVVAGLFDKLQSERKPEKRRKLLHAWFDHWRKQVGYDLYPVLRLILPQKDRERAIYGLKEKNLAKAYIKLIPLGSKDPDAIQLLNWKKPSDRYRSSGDFPLVLYEVVNKRSSVTESLLSVHELNDILDDLSKNTGKHDAQVKILQRIYNSTTPEEQRWIVRVILKDLNVNVKETTIFSVFHPDAHDLFNTCSDLKKVAWELWDPARRLNAEEKAVQLFHAFAPMLCKRPTKRIEESVKDMGGRTFILEEKLDGERMQLHKRGNEYFYCSRKGKDYTYLYGKHVGTGSLTPFVDAAFDERIEDIILDGEMLVWDPVSEKNLPFGTLKTAALNDNKKELNPRPCFKIFDLLYLNGMSLIHRSTKFRKRNLKAYITEIHGRIEFVAEFEAKTAKDVREKMDEIMANRGEGLVMKHPEAEYVLDGRNRDWIKVKPEYMDNMGETVDVLVVAANYGSGRRGGGVSTLICAVLDDRNSDEGEEPKYSTFVRIGSGFSYTDYLWIRDKPWKTWDQQNSPSFLQTAARSLEDKGDVYLDPEDSFIIKVKAAEITSSDQYHLGMTMRFPRALSIRDDLSIHDCVTATAVMESQRSEKKRKAENEAGKSTKKRRGNGKPLMLPEYQSTNVKGVQVESDLFEGMTFTVVSDPRSRTRDADKQEIFKIIRANGGKIVQIAKNQPGLLVVYGGSTTPYDIKSIMDKGLHDIIRPQWIIDCVAASEKVAMSKKYFFHATAVRMHSNDYNIEDDGSANDELNAVRESGTPTAPVPIQESRREDDEKTDTEDEDSELRDWFQIQRKHTAPTSAEMSDSATDPDSDHEDFEEPIDVDDEWLSVDIPEESTDNEVSQDSSKLAVSVSETEPSLDVKMGENDNAMEYDQELIFKHLCFYLDSPDNARKHGMPCKAKHEDDISRNFFEMDKMIIQNGGAVVELDDPKLTHVISDKRDDSRRRELISRTSKPKRRNIVVADWIQACLDEDTLLDETDFAP